MAKEKKKRTGRSASLVDMAEKNFGNYGNTKNPNCNIEIK